MLRDRRGEVAAHAVSRRLFARNHRKSPHLSFIVEILHKPLELSRRQAVERVECNGGAAWLLRGYALTIGIARDEGERNGEQAGDAPNAPRAANAVTPTPLHRHPYGRAFCSLTPPAGVNRSGNRVLESRLAASLREN